MFTGLIEAVGHVAEITPLQGGLSMVVSIPAQWRERLSLGASVAIDGCCTTVVALSETTFSVVASPETLSRTIMGTYQPGHRVNLELPLTPTSALGGHYVTGHIDCLATVCSVVAEGVSWVITLGLSGDNQRWMRYLIEKGSVALNGVSLTVNGVEDAERQWRVAIIPHTWEQTNLALWQAGTVINVEFDLLGKYVERLLPFRTE